MASKKEHKTILLVEDDAIIAAAAAAKLKKFGYRPVTAYSGEEAVQYTLENPEISLVLMDIDLGDGMDGTSAACKILDFKNLPIVFLTSHSEKEYVDKVKKITRYGYVLKNSGDFVLRSSIDMAYDLFETHQKLLDSEEKYSAAFRTSPDAVNINDMDGLYVDINEGFTKLTGYTREDVLGVNSSEIKIWSIPEDRVRLIEGLMKTGLVENLETVFRLKDGSLKTGLMSARVIRIGNRPHILSITRDIHDRKQAEQEIVRKNEELAAANEELQSMNEEYQATNEQLMSTNDSLDRVESELLENQLIFRLFMKHSPIYVFFKDEKIRAVKLSDNYEKMLGRPMEEILGKTMDDLFPSDLAKSMIADDMRILSEGKEITVQEELNGRYYRTIKFPIIINGNPRYLAGFTMDVTNQKLAELALQESEVKFRTLFETMSLGVVYQDLEGKIIDANSAAQKILGLTPDQMQGRSSIDPHWKSIHEDGSPFPGETHPTMVSLRTGNKVRNCIMGVYNPEKGDYTWININSVPYFKNGQDKPCQAFATFEDITDQMKALKALRESEERLRIIFNEAPIGISSLNADTVVTSCNTRLSEIIGASPEKMIGVNLMNYLQDSRQKEALTQALKGRIGIFEGEYTSVMGGKTSLVRISYSPITGDSGSVTGVICITDDITERKAAEDALRVKDRAIETAINAIAIAGMDGNLSYVNRAFLRMWGYDSMAEVIGQPATDFWEMGEKAAEVLDVVKHEGGWIGELTGKRKDRTRFDVQVSTGIVLDIRGNPLCIQASFVDITERKIADGRISTLLNEKEILLKEVHHRIKNNMVTTISIITLQMDMLKNPTAIAALSDARSRLLAMEKLYDKLYRSDNLKEMAVKDYLSPLIDEIIGTFSQPSSVMVSKYIDDCVLDIKRMSALGIIVNELITNAMKYAFANRERGSIRVSLAVKEGGATLVTEDDGPGIPVSVDIGKSEGFGLNLVEIMVRQIKGKIMIERGKGTKIVLDFPL